MAGDNKPYYPHKKVSYGNVYFFIKAKTHNLNAFDKVGIRQAKRLILLEAKKVSPSHKDFLKAATRATGLSRNTVEKIIYSKEA